jgi:hypothetical protein
MPFWLNYHDLQITASLTHIIMLTFLFEELAHVHAHALYSISKMTHTSARLVEGTSFSSLVLHPVRRSGMRRPCTTVVWVCAVRGRHWPATAHWPVSTVPLVVRASRVPAVISQVWATLRHKTQIDESFIAPHHKQEWCLHRCNTDNMLLSASAPNTVTNCCCYLNSVKSLFNEYLGKQFFLH